MSDRPRAASCTSQMFVNDSLGLGGWVILKLERVEARESELAGSFAAAGGKQKIALAARSLRVDRLLCSARASCY